MCIDDGLSFESEEDFIKFKVNGNVIGFDVNDEGE